MTDIPAEAAIAIGRSVKADDWVAQAAVEAMAATLGRSATALNNGDPLPPLWHGMFCTAKLPRWRLGADGLAMDEPLLPAIPGFPARIFAGADFRFERPIAIGDRIRKESTILGFEAKSGRSGALLFAKVEHRIFARDDLAVVEENDIVYRAAEMGGRPADASGPRGKITSPNASPLVWRRIVDPDPVLMFRHSAVTFNSHRIHYDRDFARAHGHPGLIMQAMLIARLMLELVRDERPHAAPSRFAFRAGQILYDTAPFTIEGAPAADGQSAQLRAFAAEGGIALSATVDFAA
jgi:3-methylfumaryl-CoA hydratase